MSVEPSLNKLVITLALDRLIKQNFADKLNEIKVVGENWKKETKEILENIEKHNKHLIKSLFLDRDSAKTATKKLQFVTNLYGRKKNKVDSLHLKNGDDRQKENINLQYFIDNYASLECPNKNNLANYFYERLDASIKLGEKLLTNYPELNKFNKGIAKKKLAVLIDLALPNSSINSFDDFAKNLKAKKTISNIIAEIDGKHEPYFEFESYYYSRSRKKIHYFTLEISKDYVEKSHDNGIKYKEGIAKICFHGGNRELKGKGKVIREGDNITVTLFYEDRKRVILCFVVPKVSTFEGVNGFQGLYVGDTVKGHGEVFSFEFVAVKKEFKEANYPAIVSTLLLRRNHFEIPNFDWTSKTLDKYFSSNNKLDNELKIIIQKIRTHGLTILNYGKSGKLFLSKMVFKDERHEISFFSAIPRRNGRRKVDIVPQSCNLSARNKEKRVIATTYNRDKKLVNIVSIDFGGYENGQIFRGAFAYHSAGLIFTDYIIAIIDPENKNQDARELSEKEIEKLEENKNYNEGIKALKRMQSTTTK